MRALLLAALLLCLLAAPGTGQELRVAGDAGGPEVELLRSILSDGRYLLLRRDTVLGPEWRHPGDVVVLDAEVRLEGEIGGRVAVVGGGLFVRPGATVAGPVVVAAGGFYPSALASIGPVLEVPPTVRVERGEAAGEPDVTLRAPPPPPRVAPQGIFGLGIPRYNRVDGVTLSGAARLRLDGAERGAGLTGTVLYHTARGEAGGVATLEVPAGRAWWGVAEAARRSATNELWIRGDLVNSLAALGLASDLRDYHEVDEALLRVERRPPQPLIQGEGWLGPVLELRVEQARSLHSRDPWSLLGDGWRPNPEIDPGVIASVVAGAGLAWRGATLRADADLRAEWAPGSPGDFSFGRVVADAAAEMRALRDHRLEVRTHLLIPVSGTVPRQRWSFVGGGNTLPTLPTAALRGDNLVFVESAYAVPLPRLQLPLLGVPELRVVQAVGSAWISGAPRPRWEQNLGAGVGFPLLEAMVYMNPADEGISPTLNVGLSFPF